MTNDSVAVLKKFSDGRDIGYTLLSDKKSKIIPAFGLLDEQFPPGSRWRGIARPLIFVVDTEGVVRRRFSERSYRDRPDVEVVLDILKKDAGQ